MWILQKYVYCFISHNPELCSYVMTDCLLTMGHHQLVQYRMISSCILFYAHGKKTQYPLFGYISITQILVFICIIAMYMYVYVYVYVYDVYVYIYIYTHILALYHGRERSSVAFLPKVGHVHCGEPVRLRNASASSELTFNTQ